MRLNRKTLPAPLVAFALVLCQPAAAQMPPPPQPPVPATVARWVRAQSVPLTSPSQLRSIVGNARVIGLGEPEHGAEDFFALRNRIVQFSVTSLGVTALAAETGYNESIAVDDYITGRAELTPSVVASVFSWSYPDGYRQNRDLLQWLHDYNARASTQRKVHFYGVDLTGGRGGSFDDARAAVDYALAYLATVDPADAASYQTRLAALLPKFNTASFAALTPLQQADVTTSLDDLIALFERRHVVWGAKTSADSFQRAEHSAVVARELNANFRSAPAESNPQAQREPAMARNVQWVLQQPNTGRVLLYEADWHISKGPMASDRWGTNLGEYLRQMLGRDYVAIGTLFGMKAAAADAPAELADPSSLAAAFWQSCEAPCVLNLKRRMPVDVGQWFSGMHHYEGGRVDLVDLRSSFDAMIYLPIIHAGALLR